jgi:hypothetical protein
VQEGVAALTGDTTDARAFDELPDLTGCRALHRPPYHVGVASRDLAEAKVALGVPPEGWTAPDVHVDPPLVTPSGPVRWTTENIFTRAGPFHIELIHGPADSIWGTSEVAQLHHLAYWSHDVGTDAAELEAEGWRMQLTFLDADGRPTEFAYLVKARAPRVELVDLRRRPSFLERLRA